MRDSINKDSRPHICSHIRYSSTNCWKKLRLVRHKVAPMRSSTCWLDLVQRFV
jgi:hypothetical protein